MFLNGLNVSVVKVSSFKSIKSIDGEYFLHHSFIAQFMHHIRQLMWAKTKKCQNKMKQFFSSFKSIFCFFF